MNRRKLFKSAAALIGVKVLEPYLPAIEPVKTYSFKDVVGVVETPIFEMPTVTVGSWLSFWQAMNQITSGRASIKETGMMIYRVTLPSDCFRPAMAWIYNNIPIGIMVEFEDEHGKLYDLRYNTCETQWYIEAIEKS